MRLRSQMKEDHRSLDLNNDERKRLSVTLRAQGVRRICIRGRFNLNRPWRGVEELICVPRS